jgi:hypothetical protein
MLEATSVGHSARWLPSTMSRFELNPSSPHDGFDAMTWGLGFSDALLPVLVLLVSAAAFLALVVARFDWETGQPIRLPVSSFQF